MTKKVRQEIIEFQQLFRSIIYAGSEEESINKLEQLRIFVQQTIGVNAIRFGKAYRSLKRNFEHTLTHFRYEGMMRDNNLIECFNGCLKPRLRLMKSFKKEENLDRYLKLFLLELY